MAHDMRFRQIHLDFHTGPAIPDVGSQFDAEGFAQTLADAHVNSVTLFAKCHHGLLYYDTNHEARHPGLPRKLDLLGLQIEACRKRDIKTPIYISVQCDEFAATTHPEWLATKPDGAPINGPLSAAWHILDMSSPYQDYLADQIAEIVKAFKPVDGIFLDMCWDQQSCSKYAVAGMKKMNLNPNVEADRVAYSKAVSFQYMGRYMKLVDGFHPGKKVPIAFNSRPLSGLVEEKQFLRHVEIEALPSGGWGYSYFPLNVRYVRTFGLPYMGMTARFHKSWADFGGLKPEAALFYECAQMLAHGARCSVGDQLHPRGFLDKASYDLIGKVYRHVEACEPWCTNVEAVTDVGVLRSQESGYMLAAGDANEGAMKALQQIGVQFDVIPQTGNLDSYKVIVVPETVKVDAALAKRLSAYIAKGGNVLFSGESSVDADGNPVLKELGVTAHGLSPFTTTYLRFDKSASQGVADADHVIYEKGLRLKPVGKAKVLGRVVEPYFERTWEHFSSHFQTPYDKVSPFAAGVENQAGKGTVVTIAYPIFKTYGTHGNIPVRQFIAAAIRRLLPDPVIRTESGPSFMETTVNRLGKKTVVHLLSFCPQRRTPTLDIVEEPTPLLNIRISLKLSKAPHIVKLQPEGVAVPFSYADGRAQLTISSFSGHTMIVFE